MYSLVLITALATATTTPGFGHSRSCYSGYYAVSCGCYGCGGCYGCSGCYGCGGCYGCCGCNGAMWTYAHYGCAGPGYGYHGGCYGGYGNWYGDPMQGPGFGCTGCYGCHGGYSGYGIPVPGMFPTIQDSQPREPGNPDIRRDDKVGKQPEEIGKPPEKKFDLPPEKKIEQPKDQSRQENNNGAGSPLVRVQVRIDVPEGGKLFVDGNRINTGAGSRTFHTPPLAMGKKYYYDVRIEIERDGQTLSENRRVIVQSPHEIIVAFPNLYRRAADTARANE